MTWQAWELQLQVCQMQQLGKLLTNCGRGPVDIPLLYRRWMAASVCVSQCLCVPGGASVRCVTPLDDGSRRIGLLCQAQCGPAIDGEEEEKESSLSKAPQAHE